MSTLHYRGSFDLTAERPECSWEMLLKAVRKWIAKRPDPDEKDDFWDAWFFQGGLWKSKAHRGIRVLTRSCYGDCSRLSPNCWAVEYEHPCDEFPKCRFWRIHTGIEQFTPSQFHLNFQTLYYMRPGYLGREPMAPLPSAPGLVTTLLRSRSWRSAAGSEQLGTSSRILRVGEGHLFAELIANGERTCPVVLVSRTYPNNGYLIDAQRLAWLLAGTGIVYQSESSEVDDELDNLLGERFGCRKGAIRVYVPGFDPKRAGEERRHRFILPKNIDEWGLDGTIDIIIRGIARRSTRPKGVLTPMDVEAVSRQRRLGQLRAKQDSGSRDEWMQLIDLLEEENKTLRNDKAQLEADKASLEDCIDSFEDDVRRLEHDKKALKASLAQTSAAADQSKLQPILESMRELPRTLSEVVQLIGAIHPGRIAFTEKAVKSASDSKFNDVHRAWKVLWAMATTLYDLYFEGDSRDIPNTFRNKTGIELAMTEKKLTKKDNRKMAQRKHTFMGQEIDITPHVKFDAASTRAYFSPFQENGTKLIVVGHIGNHLDTAGTRRQR